MNNKKIALLSLMIMAFALVSTSVLAEPSFTITPTSETVTVSFDETSETFFEIENTGTDTITSINVTYNQSDFRYTDGREVKLTFAGTTGTLSKGQTREITITINPDDGISTERTFNGDIQVTVFDGSTALTKTFDLTLNVQQGFVRIDLDEDDLEDELSPGQEFSFKIDVDNIADEDLENIDVEAVVENIDDGDDLDDEMSISDLDDGDDDTAEFTFTVPYNIDEDRYDLVITVTGEDSDGNDFEVTKRFNGAVDVEKDEDEEVFFDNINVPESSLSCGALINIDADLINTGIDDLDDMYVRLIIESGATRIVQENSEEFNLDGDDGSFSNREDSVDFSVSLPNDLTETSYTLRLVAYNEDNDIVGEVVEQLTVNPCKGSSDSDSDEDVIPPTTGTGNQNGSTGGNVFLPTGLTTFGLSNTTWTTMFWILGDILLVIVAIYFLSLIFRKRR